MSTITAGDATPGEKYTTRGQETVTAGAVVDDNGVKFRVVVSTQGVSTHLPMDFPLTPLDDVVVKIQDLVDLPEEELRPRLEALSDDEMEALIDEDGRTWILDYAHERAVARDGPEGQQAEAPRPIVGPGDAVEDDAPPPMAAKLAIAEPTPGDVTTSGLRPHDVVVGSIPDAGSDSPSVTGRDDPPPADNVVQLPSKPAEPSGDGEPGQDQSPILESPNVVIGIDHASGNEGDGASFSLMEKTAEGYKVIATAPARPGMGICSMCSTEQSTSPKVGDEQLQVLQAHTNPDGAYCMGGGKPPADPASIVPPDDAGEEQRGNGQDAPDAVAPAVDLWQGQVRAGKRIDIVKAAATLEDVERLRQTPADPALQTSVEREFDRQAAGLQRVIDAEAKGTLKQQIKRLRELLLQPQTKGRPGAMQLAEERLAVLDPPAPAPAAVLTENGWGMQIGPNVVGLEKHLEEMLHSRLGEKIPVTVSTILDEAAAAEDARPVAYIVIGRSDGGWDTDAAVGHVVSEMTLASLGGGVSWEVNILPLDPPMSLGRPATADDLETYLQDRLESFRNVVTNVTVSPDGDGMLVLVVGGSDEDLAYVEAVLAREDVGGPGVEYVVRSDAEEEVEQPAAPAPPAAEPVSEPDPPSWDLSALPFGARVARSSFACARELIADVQDTANGPALLCNAWAAVEKVEGDTRLLELIEERWEAITGHAWVTDPPLPESVPGDAPPAEGVIVEAPPPGAAEVTEEQMAAAHRFAEARFAEARPSPAPAPKRPGPPAHDGYVAQMEEPMRKLQKWLSEWPAHALIAQRVGIRMEIHLTNEPPADLGE